ncbi:MAG TPA: hypothetical protein VLB73_00575 [Patescibacteria group bacterium]|nr:hypothetical protein [Patescibacteria group bacterium]
MAQRESVFTQGQRLRLVGASPNRHGSQQEPIDKEQLEGSFGHVGRGDGKTSRN